MEDSTDDLQVAPVGARRTALEVCSVFGLSEIDHRVILHRGRSKVRQPLERCHRTFDRGVFTREGPAVASDVR